MPEPSAEVSADLLAEIDQLSDLELAQLERRLNGLQLTTEYPSPGAFACALDPNVRQTPALRMVDERLVDVAEGRVSRQMLFMPPQEGKSQRVSVWFPLWLLTRDPTLRIAIVSYSREMARRWGVAIRRVIFTHPELGLTLRRDSISAERFETIEGGRVICVGIGGGITGEPVDVMVIDDPVRGRAEAESPTYRDRAWEWWESNGYERLSSRGRVVLMMTRWHEDDLAGRLLARESGRWKVLRIRPISELEILGSDGAALYSEAGELVSVQDRAPDYFHITRGLRSAYVWRSEYDQDPVAPEGNLFRRPDYRYWWPMPAEPARRAGLTGGRRLSIDGTPVWLEDCFRFITIDLAASVRTSADWTVVSAWAIDLSGNLILLDRKRARLEEHEHFSLVRPLANRFVIGTAYLEASWIGTTLVVDATKAGIHIEPVYAETDKLTRALPAADRLRQHKVWFPAHVDWLDDWCDELAAFPNAEYDDQVDTLAYAARVTSAHWIAPPDQRRSTRRSSPPSGLDQAYAAAVGSAGFGAGAYE